MPHHASGMGEDMPRLPRTEYEQKLFDDATELARSRHVALEDLIDELFVAMFEPSARLGGVEERLVDPTTRSGSLAIGYLRNARVFAATALSEMKAGAPEPEDRPGNVDGG